MTTKNSASNERPNFDFAKSIGRIAKELLGAPNPRQSSPGELRFGRHGSLSVDLSKGVWHDHERNRGGGALDLIRDVLNTDKAGALSWLRERNLLPDAEPRRIVATYDYFAEDGELLFQVVRYQPKDFRQRRPDGRGGWIYKMGATRRVLFRLPEMVEAIAAGRIVYVAEGEKGCEALVALGAAATCSPGGAGKWRAEYAAALRGADVVILPDNDDAGRAHARTVAASLRGVAQRVRVLTLPGLPPKGDVADWIAAGGTLSELQRLPEHAAEAGPSGAPSDALPAADTAGGEPDDDGDPPEWAQYLQRDDRGQVVPNLANAALALRQAPELIGLLAYDEMLRLTTLRRPVPASLVKDSTMPRPITDADVGAVQEWLQRHDLRRLGKETLHQAVDLVGREHAFHPVRAYLRGLRWDGVPRIGKWLPYYLGAEPTPYTLGIGRLFLIAMVARVMRPGCKADYMLVLEGEQGVRKSSACAILGGAWFSDALPALHHGDAVRVSTHLRGKWLIEVAELHATNKAEAGALKAFLTQTEERFVPKYGRSEVIEPRQCIFVGSTNKTTYLRDETGGRRFWPVNVGTIDTDSLAHDRDQLFAEALHEFDLGAKWWPAGEFEREHILAEQEARFEVDEWEETIRVWLQGRERCTVSEVAYGALFIERARFGTRDQRRVAAAMERLGWVRGTRDGPNGKQSWRPRHV